MKIKFELLNNGMMLGFYTDKELKWFNCNALWFWL